MGHRMVKRIVKRQKDEDSGLELNDISSALQTINTHTLSHTKRIFAFCAEQIPTCPLLRHEKRSSVKVNEVIHENSFLITSKLSVIKAYSERSGIRHAELKRPLAFIVVTLRKLSLCFVFFF